ncbi:MAG: hypothetical protein AAF609_18585 [Cyanobacteria bacterium P01_C01_bin.120]
MTSGETWLYYGFDGSSTTDYWLVLAAFVGLLAWTVWLMLSDRSLRKPPRNRGRDSWPWR